MDAPAAAMSIATAEVTEKILRLKVDICVTLCWFLWSLLRDSVSMSTMTS
jgi:hypothetical protein